MVSSLMFAYYMPVSEETAYCPSSYLSKSRMLLTSLGLEVRPVRFYLVYGRFASLEC